MNLPYNFAGADGGDGSSMWRFLLVFLLIIGSAFGEGELVRIGPEFQPVLLVIANAQGSTFLMNDVVLNHGILFAFSAFFVNPTRIYFQVWRPVRDNANFQLVFQTSMVPTTTGKREDLYVVSTLRDRCPVVQNGDKVGVYFPLGDPAVSRFFDTENPNTFRFQSENASIPLEVGKIVHFDPLPFPYKLNVQAWILVTNESFQNEFSDMYVECPRVLIPEHRPELITISPGETGATGPVGAAGPQGARGRDGDTGGTGGPGNSGPTGATGSTGTRGDTGSVGPFGIQGPSGLQGMVGAMGSTGEIGDAGLRGFMGPPGPPGASLAIQSPDALASRTCSGPMMSEGFLIGMLIWLVLLTLLLLTILVGMVVLCLELRNRREKQDEDAVVDLGKEMTGVTGSRSVQMQHAPISHPNEYEFSTVEEQPTDFPMLGMKDEQVSSFSLETIETTDGEDLKQRKQSDDSSFSVRPIYGVLQPDSLSGISNPVYADEDPASHEKQLDDVTTHTDEM